MQKWLLTLLLFGSSVAIQATSRTLDLIPLPQHLSVHEGSFILNPSTKLFVEAADADKAYFHQRMEKLLGNRLVEVNKAPTKNGITLRLNPALNLGSEAYRLRVDQHGILLESSDADGLFWGIQTLFQLLPNAIYSGERVVESLIPFVEIEDAPRFAWRGAMLDVSRQFFSIEFILQYLDWLAMHKMNKFHWHLTDDNGWRVEIKKYPHLTEKGAWRGPNEVIPPAYGSGNKRYGGFYTQADIREVVAYAKERHIEVIPEIDLPGHSRASVGAYPEIACAVEDTTLSVNGEMRNLLCVAREENYHMLEDIVAELAALFPSSYLHAGGDEVNPSPWTKCPHCRTMMEQQGWSDPHQLQNYFTRRVEAIIRKAGKRMIGWNEIMKGGELDPSTVVFAWQSTQHGFEAARRGWDCVMMPGQYTYIDMQYTPYERGHNWAAIIELDRAYSFDPLPADSLTPEQQKRILGLQACLWSESLDKPARQVEYQTFPRLCAIAEIGWSAQEQRNYPDFYQRLYTSHLARLKAANALFRVNPPTLTVDSGTIQVASPYDKAVVRYTTDGSEPTLDSPEAPRTIILEGTPNRYRFRAWYLDYPSPTIPLPLVDTLLLQPNVEVTTNMPALPRWEASKVADWNPRNYFRSARPCVEGDWFNFSFAEPLSCSAIEVETGLRNISRYELLGGHVELSYDGEEFERVGEITEGMIRILPKAPIHHLRIVVDRENGEPLLAIKGLRIEP